MPHINTRMAIIDISQFLDMVLLALGPTLFCSERELLISFRLNLGLIQSNSDPVLYSCQYGLRVEKEMTINGTLINSRKLKEIIVTSAR